ncbi:serine-rich adhesin for platelets [Musca vetustissima]|uniref:serine-rich adhesin for platelets n=1 Tax=Musca vetustissima TaxID=27455 RepID=UPI002AB7AC0D|nr:serine-rich adhesin for platelets [Musca vetustissima]
MPCEQCHVQFTVFKRKKSCSDCKRYYCHSCLVSTRKHSLLCDRCLLFSRRPLQRSDLVQLKTKDLIFYLQSKHISTAGCVEKEDLIDLVMRMDSNQNPSSSSGSSSKSSSKSTTPQHQPTSAGNGGTGADAGTGGNTNSFDNIKQTCQNFFSSLSENISDSFANLESRACSKSRADRQNRSAANVTEQPRVATREIPTYASRQQRTVSVDVSSPTESTHARSPISVSSSLPPQPERQTSALSSPQSPTSIEIGTVAEEPQPTATTEGKSPTRIAEEGDCECSDEEELIATFSTRTRSPKIAIEPSLSNDETDLANAGGPSTSASTSKPSSQYSKLEIYINEEEESSHSSFEELGAIGGISDDSKTTTDTTSNTTDQWQMLDLKQDGSSNQTLATPDGNNSTLQQPAEETTSPKPQPSAPPPAPPLRLKKVTRRRSESYLNRRRPQISLEEDEDDEDGTILSVSIHNPASRIEEETQTSSTTSNTTAKRCCLRCGKNKVNIRHQVEKLRKHLESSQMSESDIKQELREFLAYLEQRTKSVEYSDSEAGTSTPSATGLTESQMAQQRDFTVSGSSAAFNYFPEANIAANQSEKESRFINLDDYDSIKQLEGLSVKQLKEVLMLHRVDYKGCCEKQELLDRVGRLWKNLKSTPAVDKLPTDELCKICMDAPIECVILECGHMATCTNCGKVLSECPICRQYIVRVVRFFRA